MKRTTKTKTPKLIANKTWPLWHVWIGGLKPNHLPWKEARLEIWAAHYLGINGRAEKVGGRKRPSEISAAQIAKTHSQPKDDDWQECRWRMLEILARRIIRTVNVAIPFAKMETERLAGIQSVRVRHGKTTLLVDFLQKDGKRTQPALFAIHGGTWGRNVVSASEDDSAKALAGFVFEDMIQSGQWGRERAEAFAILEKALKQL